VDEASQDSRPARARREPGARARLWPPPEGTWLALIGLAPIFLGHWFYGALISDVALIMDLAAALTVAGVLAHPRLRADLLRLRGLAWPGLAMAATVAVALLTLTPAVPGGPHPVWAFVGVSPGAATLDRSATIVEIVKLLGLACIFVVGATTGASDARARSALAVTVWLSVAFGLWAFFASVTGTVYQSQGQRLEARFLTPNTAGTFFAILLVLGVALLTQRLRRTSRDKVAAALPLALAVLVFGACLLMSASRAGSTAALAALAAFALSQLLTGRWKVTRTAAGAGLAATVGLAVLLFVTGDYLVQRFFTARTDIVDRAFVWSIHWDVFLGSPLFGEGLGSFESVTKARLTDGDFPLLWNIRAAHSVYLQWLEQAGLVGAIPMFLAIGLVMYATLRGALRRNRMTSLLYALLAVDLVFLLHGVTDFALETPSMSAFWAWLLGLQFALAQGSSSR
jgi:O-antigen ligase